MSWVAVGTGIISVGGGLLSGSKADKEKKQALQLQRERLEFDKMRYNDANTLYSPIISKMVTLAQEGVDPDLEGVSDRASADVRTQFANQEAQLARNNARMGISPDSNYAQSSMRKTALSEALASAGTITAAREAERNAAEQKSWDRLSSASTLGVNQMNGTAANYSNSMASVANAYSNLSSGSSQTTSNALSSGMSAIAQGLLSKFGTKAVN